PVAAPGRQGARGDVVGTRIAEDHFRDALGRNLAAKAAEHDGELTLVVHPLAEVGWPNDGVTWPGNCRRRLEENDRLFRCLGAHFPSVLGVVPADAAHLAP